MAEAVGAPARVISRLDIKGPNLVKGVHLEGLRVLGKPETFARLYYEGGADELLFMDAVASLYGRNSLSEVVRRTASETFVPLCVGGGLRTVDDMRRILRAGADKVAVNTAAMADPSLLQRAAREFGSSTIVLSIEAIRQGDGSYHCFTDGGRESTGVEVGQWAVRACELGAGELLVTSVDRDGTGLGYDIELTSMVASAVPVPVVASGGAGSSRDVAEVLTEGKAEAACVASILHYHLLDSVEVSADDFALEGNIEFRQKRTAAPMRLETIALPDLRRSLANASVWVRP